MDRVNQIIIDQTKQDLLKTIEINEDELSQLEQIIFENERKLHVLYFDQQIISTKKFGDIEFIDTYPLEIIKIFY